MSVPNYVKSPETFVKKLCSGRISFYNHDEQRRSFLLSGGFSLQAAYCAGVFASVLRAALCKANGFILCRVLLLY
jgi:hypothetical protein